MGSIISSLISYQLVLHTHKELSYWIALHIHFRPHRGRAYISLKRRALHRLGQTFLLPPLWGIVRNRLDTGQRRSH